MKPWNAEHAAGCITLRLGAKRISYQAINVLMLRPRDAVATPPAW
jgi:antirestriction protein ArdC